MLYSALEVKEVSVEHPGVLQSLTFQGINQTEEMLLRKLGLVWYVTFAKRYIYRNVDYTFAFAKPTDELVRDFHLGREVLVVLAGSSQFQSRTLDFVDQILLEYPNRLDKLCVLIVSSDFEIKNKINNIIKQDKSSRILIPYTYQELQTTNWQFENFVIR